MIKRKNIAIIIGVLLVIGIMLNMLILQSCKQKPKETEQQSVDWTDEIKIEDMSGDSVSIDDSVEKDSTDTSSIDTVDTAETVDTNDSTDTEGSTDTEISSPNSTENNGVFEIINEGVLKGSVTNCDTIKLKIGDLLISSEEYFSNTKYYIEKFNNDFSYAVVGELSNVSENRISLVMNKSGEFIASKFLGSTDVFSISQISGYSFITDVTTEMELSINGVCVGSSYDDVIELFGKYTQLEYNDETLDNGPIAVLRYIFEDESQIEITLLNKVVDSICIKCAGV